MADFSQGFSGAAFTPRRLEAPSVEVDLVVDLVDLFERTELSIDLALADLVEASSREALGLDFDLADLFERTELSIDLALADLVETSRQALGVAFSPSFPRLSVLDGCSFVAAGCCEPSSGRGGTFSELV